mgnify:CR=1 FL=1
MRLSTDGTLSPASIISIHAPIVGCDFSSACLSYSPDYFNPRTHRGVRPFLYATVLLHLAISIHAPIVGCDNAKLCIRHHIDGFQSTHPSWGATFNDRLIVPEPLIYFNPRTHRGVRQEDRLHCRETHRFQSTHPSWGATLADLLKPLEGTDFNPRTHRGVRLYISQLFVRK